MKIRMMMAVSGVMAVAAVGLHAADAAREKTPRPAANPQQLFPDDVLCKGKGIEIKRSELDDAFLQFKANLNARGQILPEDKREQVESQLLDRLVVTRLLLGKATREDRTKARTAADKFIANTKEQAGSEESFNRQLGAMNFTAAQFDAQVLERAVCEEVVDRELKSKINVTDEQIKKFYDENGQQFERPEMVRAAHILLSTRDANANQELSEEKKKEKKQQLEKILERARKGEDFAALAREFSEDPGSKSKGGEYTFPRGQMMPEFETAAFSLKTNQISDIITTQFGYHIIKLYEKTPAQKLELVKVKDDLKEQLARFEVQDKMLPDYLKKLRKEAGLEYLHGAKQPEEVSPESPAAKPAEKSGDKPPATPEKRSVDEGRSREDKPSEYWNSFRRATWTQISSGILPSGPKSRFLVKARVTGIYNDLKSLAVQLTDTNSDNLKRRQSIERGVADQQLNQLYESKQWADFYLEEDDDGWYHIKDIKELREK